MKRHGRVPKGSERGNMQSIYTKYRELKKEIRDLAAVDIQRLIRGFIIRQKFVEVSTLNKRQSLPYVNRKLNMNYLSTAQTSKFSSSKSLNGLEGLWPSNQSGNNLSSSSSLNGLPSDVFSKYRELLNSKRDLKRRLKKFDEDFFEKYKRQPKKADKEVIRPMYQKYHEVCNDIARSACSDIDYISHINRLNRVWMN